VDPAVGILVEAKPGARVAKGQALARVLVRNKDEAAAAIAARVAGAFALGEACPPQRPLLLGRIDGRSTAQADGV
jgi:thymidine phosphorylase